MTQVGTVAANNPTANTQTLKAGTKIQNLYGNNELTIQFTEADKDKDGILSEEELFAFTNTVSFSTDMGEQNIYPGMDIKDIKNSEFFKDIDINEDGKVSKKELDIFKKLKDNTEEKNLLQKQVKSKNFDLTLLSCSSIGAIVGFCLMGTAAAPGIIIAGGALATFGAGISLAVAGYHLLCK